jgi:hypothetical protein
MPCYSFFCPICSASDAMLPITGLLATAPHHLLLDKHRCEKHGLSLRIICSGARSAPWLTTNHQALPVPFLAVRLFSHTCT